MKDGARRGDREGESEPMEEVDTLRTIIVVWDGTSERLSKGPGVDELRKVCFR